MPSAGSQKNTEIEQALMDTTTPNAYRTIICDVVNSRESMYRKTTSQVVGGRPLKSRELGHRFAVVQLVRNALEGQGFKGT